MKYIFSFLICSLGGLLFSFIGVPLGFMFGSLFITIIAAKSFKFKVVTPLFGITLIQLVLGTSVGLMFKDITFAEIETFGVVIIFLLTCLTSQFIVSYLWLYKKSGWTKEEAVLGAVPGAMAAMLALTEHIKSPPQKIVISHTIRLMTLIFIAGAIVGMNSNSTPISTIGNSFTITIISWLILSIVIAYVLGRCLERFHFPAPYMLTSLFSAITIHLVSNQHLIFPSIINSLCLVFMGMSIGKHFSNFTLSSLIKNITSSIQVVFLSLIVTVLNAYIASKMIKIPFDLLLISWMPGSVETMTFAAIALNFDAGFVMSNHILRMLLIQTIPAIVIWFKKSNGS